MYSAAQVFYIFIGHTTSQLSESLVIRARVLRMQMKENAPGYGG